MHSSRTHVAALVVCLVTLAASAQASPIPLLVNNGVDGPRDGWTGSGLYAGTLGEQFTVGSLPITVGYLGYYDGPNSANGAAGDGLLNAHEVGLWTSTGTLISSLSVPAGTADLLVGDFRYVALSSPVTLAANTTYVLGGQVTTTDLTSSGDIFINNTGGTQSPLASGYSGVYTGPGNPSFNDGVFTFPTFFGATNLYAGPNLLITATPEPSSMLLCGMGAFGLLVAARRRRE